MLSSTSHHARAMQLQEQSKYLGIRQTQNDTTGPSSSPVSFFGSSTSSSTSASENATSTESGSSFSSSSSSPSPSLTTDSSFTSSFSSTSTSLASDSSSTSTENSTFVSPSSSFSVFSSTSTASPSQFTTTTSSDSSNVVELTSSDTGRILVTQESSSFEPTPATTFELTSAITPSTSTSSLVASTSGLSTAAAVSSDRGFWSNKPAVAGLITAIIVAVLTILVALYLLVKRKQNSKGVRDIEFLEKDSELSRTNSGHPSEPSSIMNPPMDTHTNLDPVYYPPDPFATAPYAADNLPAITYSYAQDVNNQYPSYPDENPPPIPPDFGLNHPSTVHPSDVRASVHPFADPAALSSLVAESKTNQNPFADAAMVQLPNNRVNLNPFADAAATSGRTAVAGSHLLQPPTRISAYQSSIDSFYGGNGYL
ncbi:hypothetical protein VKT23_001861 [Stygiomarasmius scandens]|uniref:Uncharacterized protein n=1 Tax=Marasmiellus scandens TaxID=2682957 RepID=A0ABR1K3W2_9AGAR